MFNKIAFRYDFLNHFLSGGIDRSWRKKAIRELIGLSPENILDVATGTADMPLMLIKILRPDSIKGIDISEGMLAIGREKIRKSGLDNAINLQQGDAESISFPDNTFDAVTVAFGVRNFQHLEMGLLEMLRVMKPGGKLVILEFSKPGKGWFLPFYTFYLKLIAPRIGKAISGNAAAYRYLNDSVNAFPEGEDFLKILEHTGYRDSFRKKLSQGICTIYCGTK